jgi:hypothetical protein
MDLNFEIFMIALLVLAVLVVGNFLRDGESNYLEGALLVVSAVDQVLCHEAVLTSPDHLSYYRHSCMVLPRSGCDDIERSPRCSCGDERTHEDDYARVMKVDHGRQRRTTGYSQVANHHRLVWDCWDFEEGLEVGAEAFRRRGISASLVGRLWSKLVPYMYNRDTCLVYRKVLNDQGK